MTTPITPGKLDTGVVWPPPSQNDKKASPKGESKIPKLMSSTSTPKARIQLVSSLFTLDPPVINNAAAETDRNKLSELKLKIGKCETIPEMLQLVRSFMNDNSMQSSESSTNSGIFTSSTLNGSDTTVFDRSMESTVFNVLQHRSAAESSTTSVKSQMTPPRTKSSSPVKSRTSPSTPTGSTNRLDPKRIKKNLSLDSVNKSVESVNGSAGCKKCAAKSNRMVDKATVMDVEPITFERTSTKSAETQTETEVRVNGEVKSSVPPPPPTKVAPPPPPMPSPGLRPPGKVFKISCQL